jgi:Lysine methyltransferase/Ankyrin repeats (many copies)
MSDNGIAVRGRWGGDRGAGSTSQGQWTSTISLPEYKESTRIGTEKGTEKERFSGGIVVPQRRVFDTAGCGFQVWDAAYLLARVLSRTAGKCVRSDYSESFDAGAESTLRAFFGGEWARKAPACVVELGAGTGVVGLALRAILSQKRAPSDVSENPRSSGICACSRVFLTDFASGVLEHLRRVVAANPWSESCTCGCDSCGESCGVFVESLSWGTSPARFGAGLRESVPADIVVASDILYSADTLPLLVQTLVDATTPDTLLVVANEDHAGVRDQFYELLKEYFTSDFLPIESDLWPEDLRKEHADAIDVAVLRRRDDRPHDVIEVRAEEMGVVDNLYSLVHEAAKRGQHAALEQMLDAHPEGAHWKDSLGNTCLHWAAAGNHLQCAQVSFAAET